MLPFAVDLAERCRSRVVLFRVVPAFYQVWGEMLPGTVDVAAAGAVAGVEIAQREVKERVRGAKRYLSNVRRRRHNAGVRDVHLMVARGTRRPRLCATLGRMGCG